LLKYSSDFEKILRDEVRGFANSLRLAHSEVLEREKREMGKNYFDFLKVVRGEVF